MACEKGSQILEDQPPPKKKEGETTLTKMTKTVI